MPLSIRTRISAAVAAALVALPLAACSATTPAPAPTPSTEPEAGAAPGSAASGGEACREASRAADDAIAQARESVPRLAQELIAGEPADFSGLFGAVGQTLDAARTGIADEAVLAALDEVRTEWDGLAADVVGLEPPDLSGVDLRDPASLAELGGLGEYGSRVSGLAAERLPALREAGERLRQACAAQ